MSNTIAYDQPVKDLIAGLNATGHITHSHWKKTMVTFHHNAGRLSHEGVLEVWKTRPASAAFDIDAKGSVAQYCVVDEYAWACANTEGNQKSISIELCNQTLGPDWLVADVTWKSGARLAGWLFANVIKAEPTAANIKYHSDWAATGCAGPYMDKIRDQVVAEVQKWYVAFTTSSGKVPTVTPPPAPKPPTKAQIAEQNWIAGKRTVTAMQKYWGTFPDGVISRQPVSARDNWPVEKWPTVQYRASQPYGSALVVAMQKTFKVPVDGIFGPVTAKAGQKWLGVKADGIWGNQTIAAMCKRIGLV